MPRTGAGIYTKPFPDVTAGTTIQSAVHNGIMGDVETDLNAPRPVIAGGTGATSATQARANLQAETAMQTVTNYDSHVWQNGSFWSGPGATSAPGASTYSGIAYSANNDPNYITVEARDVVSGLNYIRQKTTTWGPWKLDAGDKLPNTGGTITGNLTITGTLGVTGTTTLGTLNAGATTVGHLASTSLTTGAISSGSINTNGNLITSGGLNTGTINSGAINAAGDIRAVRSGGLTGVIYFGTGDHYLFYNGTDYSMPNGGLSVGGNVTAGTFNGNLNGTANYATSAGSASSAGYATSAGSAPASGGSADYATNSNYANSAGSAPANGGTSSAARSLVTNSGSRTWSVYGAGTNLIIDDSSAGLRAAEFTAYGTNGAGTIDLWLPYHTVTANGVNGSFTNGFICESISSARYKADIQDMPRDASDKLMAFRPVTFRSKCPIDDPDQIHFGLIAEEVEAIEPRLVMYGHGSEDYVNERGAEGEPIRHSLRAGAKKQVRGLDYNAIVTLMLAKMQDQERRIALLEAKLNQ